MAFDITEFDMTKADREHAETIIGLAVERFLKELNENQPDGEMGESAELSITASFEGMCNPKRDKPSEEEDNGRYLGLHVKMTRTEFR